MGQFIDLSGQRFGRLTVLGRAGSNKYNYATWLCICDCGKKTIVAGKSLRTGNTKSCGCLVVDDARAKNEKYIKTHGKTNTRLFRVWSSMKTRCDNPNATSYSDYGGRGITVCDEWEKDFESFYKWAMEQGYDPTAKRGEHTIDRIDSNKGYSPENCRLANSVQQANNRRSTRFITVDGDKRSLSEWARYYGRHVSIFQHMTDDEAIERIRVYEAYKREHNVTELPRRVAQSIAEYARRKM